MASLLKIALVLGEIEQFEHLFTIAENKLSASIDELLDDQQRKRGRK